MATGRFPLRWLRLVSAARLSIANRLRPIQPIRTASFVDRPVHTSALLSRREKIPKKPTYDADDEEEEDEDDDDEHEVSAYSEEVDGSAVRSVNVKRPRLDAILKVGCNISRNAADEVVNGGRVFVNGRRALKKSLENVGEGALLALTLCDAAK